MKKTLNLKSIAMAVAVASSSLAAVAPVAVQADSLTGNMGVVSKYVFRGVPQAAASGQGGFDYEMDNGAYVGVWGSELDGKGLETDVYGGFGMSVEGVDLGIGATYYGYTKDSSSDSNAFDTSYTELNLSAGFSGLELGVNVGSHAKAKAGKDEDYTVLTAGYAMGNASFLVGSAENFVSEQSYTWAEVSYGAEVAAGTDASMTLIYSGADSGAYTDGDSENQALYSLVVGLTKSFDL